MKKWILILSVIACTQMVVGADMVVGVDDDDLGYLGFDDETMLAGLAELERASLEEQPQANEELPDLMQIQAPLQTRLNEALASAPLNMQIAEAGANLARTAPVMQAPSVDQQSQPTLFTIPPTVIAQAVQAAQAAAVQEYIEEEEEEEAAQAAMQAVTQAAQEAAATPPAKPKKKKTQGEHTCPKCFTAFTRNDNLKRHMRIHTGDRSFKCDTCDKIFSNSYGLRRHKIIHTGESEYKCKICNKALQDLNGLTVHIRFNHTKERPFKCDSCSKSFVTSSHLKRHKAIHRK